MWLDGIVDKITEIVGIRFSFWINIFMVFTPFPDIHSVLRSGICQYFQISTNATQGENFKTHFMWYSIIKAMGFISISISVL